MSDEAFDPKTAALEFVGGLSASPTLQASWPNCGGPPRPAPGANPPPGPPPPSPPACPPP